MEKNLQEAMRELRRELDISQTELGERLGLSLPTVSRYENGHYEPEPIALVGLYEMAKKAKRDDLAGVFLRGGKKEFVVLDRRARDLVIEFLPSLDEYFMRIASLQSEINWDPKITSKRKDECVKEILEATRDGRKLIDTMLKDVAAELNSAK